MSTNYEAPHRVIFSGLLLVYFTHPWSNFSPCDTVRSLCNDEDVQFFKDINRISN